GRSPVFVLALAIRLLGRGPAARLGRLGLGCLAVRLLARLPLVIVALTLLSLAIMAVTLFAHPPLAFGRGCVATSRARLLAFLIVFPVRRLREPVRRADGQCDREQHRCRTPASRRKSESHGRFPVPRIRACWSPRLAAPAQARDPVGRLGGADVAGDVEL